jgi:hypothetical protein
MGGGETIAEQILKTFALPDVVGSKTSSKKLINLLRGHVLLSTYNLPPSLPIQAGTLSMLLRDITRPDDSLRTRVTANDN